MIANRLAAGLLLPLLALAACAGALTRAQPERRQYVIEATRPELVVAPAGAPVLAVSRFRSSPLVGGTGFVYRTGPQTYERDYYDVFWAPPESMLADATRSWLAGSGLFSDTIDATSLASRSLVLEGSVGELYGDAQAGAEPRAVMAVRFALLDVRTGQPAVLFHRDYRAAPAVPAATPEAFAAGWSAALEDILGRLEADLRPAVARDGDGR